MAGKVVLAYSGGLDTSVAIKWIEEKYGLDVVTCTVDIGQHEDLNGIGERGKKIGAVNHYQIDAKKEFAVDYVFPSIKANSLYEGSYPLSTSLARPLLAEKLVLVAKKENAVAVAHGCTGKGNDQVRFDVTIKTMNPKLKIIAPVREWNLNREDEIRYAQSHGIPVKAKKSIFSTDQNLWGRSIEAGPLEDPFFEPPDEAFEWCVPAKNAPDRAEYLSIEFAKGIPVLVDGKRLPPVDLIQYVNQKAGSNGFGVIDHIEDRVVGLKSRETYECPAALTLIAAHKDLEKLVLTRQELAFESRVDEEWAWLVYSGLWLEPLRNALDAFIDTLQQRVNGTVKVKFYKGGMRVVGRKSKNSLYQHKLSTFGRSSTFDQNSALGFIELWGLSSRVANERLNAKRKTNPLVLATSGQGKRAYV
ncbi:MAG: argininosuccinate synthase [Nitrososphaerota archaeon]|nr:argininosuccinate synthase [Nitrososphaerota archaeon]MDG6923523.1 argininosuccinate synthase [Nitrososphaerota archaeon]